MCIVCFLCFRALYGWPPSLQSLISKCVFLQPVGRWCRKPLSSEVTWAVWGRDLQQSHRGRGELGSHRPFQLPRRNARPLLVTLLQGPLLSPCSCPQWPSTAHSGLMNFLNLLCLASWPLPLTLCLVPLLLPLVADLFAVPPEPTCVLCSGRSPAPRLFLATDPRSRLEDTGPRPTGRDRVKYGST